MAAKPRVTVIVANFNGQRYLATAVKSVLSQTLTDLEVIVVDDASTDDSVRNAQDLAREDPRITVIAREKNGGPAAARNDALRIAKGTWTAVLDSDDAMHPERLERLVAAAEEAGADIIADDCLVFYDDGERKPHALLPSFRDERWIELPEYIRSNAVFGRGPALGYLKPLIRTQLIARDSQCYNEALRIAEDYDFVVKLMLAGARYRLVPFLGYLYRKHSRSISHRLSTADLQAMLREDAALVYSSGASHRNIAKACARRRRSIETALAFDRLVFALKGRRYRDALTVALANPKAVALLRLPLRARVLRVMNPGRSGKPPKSGAQKDIYILSKQRIIGNSNGSSAYLLGIAGALKEAGYRLHLVAPSPAVFGRWPYLRLGPETAAFQTIRIRDAWKIGRTVVARDLTIVARAALTVLGRLLNRFSRGVAVRDTPAPYAVATPWQRDDQLFVAQSTNRGAWAVIADYAFLTPGFPYCLSPEAKKLVVMHDLFSSRQAQFDGVKASDSVASLDFEAEMKLLGQADAVIAIQDEEAAIVRSALPERRMILTPMGIDPVDRPQPGAGRRVLFVGSNTAPNVLGLRWFLDHVWPRIREREPTAELLVAGGVCRTVAGPGDGVRLLGFVPDLALLYREAAVVISPLQVGSGLKIKLIEALGHGKAIVATSTTLQGVESLVAGSVCVRDDPEPFADAVAELLGSENLRQVQSSRALDVARQHFSREACHRELLTFLGEERHSAHMSRGTQRSHEEV